MDRMGESLHDFPGFTLVFCQLRPESRGRLMIRSADPCEHPKIEPNYLSAQVDKDVAIAGSRLTQQIVESSPVKELISEELNPVPDYRSDEALLDHARYYGNTCYHPVSTCKMGSDPMAVVDDKLKVHGKAVVAMRMSVALSERVPRGYRSMADQLKRSSSAVVAAITEAANRRTRAEKADKFASARTEAGPDRLHLCRGRIDAGDLRVQVGRVVGRRAEAGRRRAAQRHRARGLL